MTLRDQRIPITHAAEKTTSRLRHVIAQLNSKISFAALTPTAKRKSISLLKRDRRNCEWKSILITQALNPTLATLCGAKCPT